MKNKSLQIIINFVNRNTGQDIKNPCRKREIIYARSVFYKLAREHTGYSFQNIGKTLGKHHATVMHSLDNVFFNAIKYSEDCKDTYNKFNGIVEESIITDVDQIQELKFRVEELEQEISEAIHYTIKEKRYRKIKGYTSTKCIDMFLKRILRALGHFRGDRSERSISNANMKRRHFG